jgi:diguanylate cyclase (GGDEF)-like protein
MLSGGTHIKRSMSLEPTVPSSANPDRLFVRASATVLCAGLAMAVTGHVVLGRMAERQAAAAEIALTVAGEAAAARAVIGMLDRLAAAPAGPDRRAAQAKLTWETERLLGLADRRAGGAATRADPPELASATDRARMLARSSAPDPAEAAALKDAFEAQLLPRLDRRAMQTKVEAEVRRARNRISLVASLALHLLGFALMVVGVVLPTQRRVQAWVARAREADRETQFRLLHDPLTQLPNGTYLQVYLARTVSAAERAETQTAVLRIDLERFKVLRETLEQRTCDEIIRIAAKRIQQALRGGDFAAHLGHDDFVVVAADLEDANAAAAIALRIQTALNKPFSIRGGARKLGCSIGVTLLSDDGPDPDRILTNAAIALAEARGAGSGNVRYFRESLRQEVERRETLFAELLRSIDNGEIVPYFQPQLDLATGGFAGFEALARWRHPRHGLLTPASFLDFADQTDLTERIGEVILTRSVEALRDWQAEGLTVPKIGVNFALGQLRDPRLIEKIKWEVERLDIEPSRLAIEVLETVLIKSDTDIVVRNLRGLVSSGFHIELDDFGTGHASIANLRRFMVDRIKIDRNFIAGIEASGEQQKLTASMIAMAHALGIRTLAEGVETAAAEAMLRQLGCDDIQGFLIARPLSRAGATRWLRAFRAGRSVVDMPESEVRSDPNTP